jgi:hypothetical protein
MHHRSASLILGGPVRPCEACGPSQGLHDLGVVFARPLAVAAREEA